MGTLVKRIEDYLKQLLNDANEDVIELKRSNLAKMFDCVPSQINYVLETRFTSSQGYYVETRRGGGGYIRIMRLSVDSSDDIMYLVEATRGKAVSQQVSEGLLERLYQEQFLTQRELLIIRTMLDNENLKLLNMDELTNQLRGQMIYAMLVTLLRQDFQD